MLESRSSESGFRSLSEFSTKQTCVLVKYAESDSYPDIYQFFKQLTKSFGVSPFHYRDQQIRLTG